MANTTMCQQLMTITRWQRRETQVLDDGHEPCLYQTANSCTIALFKAGKYRQVCSDIYHSCMCIHNRVSMNNVCTCIYTVCTCICNLHTCFVCTLGESREKRCHSWGYIGCISLFVHNGQSLYNSIVHTYVKGCTGEYAVAYTAVVYAYNMCHPCTARKQASRETSKQGPAPRWASAAQQWLAGSFPETAYHTIHLRFKHLKIETI